MSESEEYIKYSLTLLNITAHPQQAPGNSRVRLGKSSCRLYLAAGRLSGPVGVSQSALSLPYMVRRRRGSSGSRSSHVTFRKCCLPATKPHLGRWEIMKLAWLNWSSRFLSNKKYTTLEFANLRCSVRIFRGKCMRHNHQS